MTVQVRGIPQMMAELKKIEQLAREGGREGVHAALDEIRVAWAARVPVDEGHYRRAMEQPKAVKSKMTKDGAVGYVNVPYIAGIAGRNKSQQQPYRYASRLEYGDTSRAPQPSARPALDAVRPRIAEIVGADVAANIRTRR